MFLILNSDEKKTESLNIQNNYSCFIFCFVIIIKELSLKRNLPKS